MERFNKNGRHSAKGEKKKDTQITNSITVKANSNGALGSMADYNPDMLIDKDGAGDDAIKSVDISFETKEVNLNSVSKNIRIVKIHITGQLYLPMSGDKNEKSKSIVGKKDVENAKKNTLRLAEWAQLQPDAKKEDGYYRGIVILCMTKAGDFRVISANNVYVENYKEDYSSGEFGAFEIHLAQRADVTSAVKVKGLDEKSKAVAAQIQEVLDARAAEAAEKAKMDKLKKGLAIAGTVAAVTKVGSAVGGKVVETVEKFTGGETAATKWAKFGLGTLTDTANLTTSAANITKVAKTSKDKNEKAQKISAELGTMTSTVLDRTNAGKDSDDAAKQLLQAEENRKKQIKALEGVYLDKINADAETKQKYEAADDAGKLTMLSALKKADDNAAAAKQAEAEAAKKAADEELDRRLKQTMLKNLGGEVPTAPAAPEGGTSTDKNAAAPNIPIPTGGTSTDNNAAPPEAPAAETSTDNNEAPDSSTGVTSATDSSTGVTSTTDSSTGATSTNNQQSGTGENNQQSSTGENNRQSGSGENKNLKN